ncbi:MAG: Uma2 family endonuclease [Lachnospiraceae bacterium]|nr:Uma2 family endonuclease [Lachnospiraceae bacterium]MCD7842752.1 Uma2 family endonuclease [Lachnospiraceae bacterium]
MPLAKEKAYTVQDIYDLPDGERAELLDGRIYYMSPPTHSHQRFVFNLARRIADYIDAKKGDCEVNIAPHAVFLNADDSNYVEPDVFVTCDKNKFEEKGCIGAPDWIIEIVSPGSKFMDYYRKANKYQLAGVREYWIVDYKRNFITVHSFENETTETYTLSDRIPVGIYNGDLQIDFAEL